MRSAFGDFLGMAVGAMVMNGAGFGGCNLGGGRRGGRRGGGAHRLIDQEIVIGVKRATVIEITIAEAFGRCPIGKASVDHRIVVGINAAAQVGVAVVGVFDEDGVGIDGLAVELTQDGGAVAAVVDDGAQRGDARVGRAGGGAADAEAVPCASVAAGFEEAIERGEQAGLGGAGALKNQVVVEKIERGGGGDAGGGERSVGICCR